MADKASGSSGGFPLNVNMLLALVTLAGSAWFASSKLTSDRPVNPAGAMRSFVGDQSLEARLWEDPFKAVDQKNPQATGPRVETNLDGVAQQIQQRTKGSDRVLLLPVMLSGGQYSEDQESRIRSRFAVVSALGQSGYVPEDAEHLGALTIPWPRQREVELAKNCKSLNPSALWLACETTNKPASFCPLGVDTQATMDVRYEWYRPRTFFSRSDTNAIHTNVLVLWLDDSFFEDEPLLRLPLLLEPLLTTGKVANERVAVSLIGPRRSSTLRGMLPGELSGAKALATENPNLWRLATNILHKVDVYCATPSAMDEVLVNEPVGAPRTTVGEQLQANGFRAFRNYAATDGQLAREILQELALRQVDLKLTNNHLMLISEWDTFYGRMVALTYGTEMALLQKPGRTNYISEFRKGAPLPSNLHSFVYLRGLDGQTIWSNPDSKNKEATTKAPTTNFEELRKWSPDANKAEGQAQFDYLGRLGEQLEQLEESLRRENARVKIAVGIVGSDVYDTLLILQALRPRFPHLLFFTTDLDARFWHPRERDRSRNLIVASGYGLTLHPKLQKEVAPFRDSMQTAQFAAALGALGNSKLAELTNVPPRRFEIGNFGAVDLSVEPGATNDVNAPYGAPHWLHPLTPQQTLLTEAQGFSLSRALDLFPWPFKDGSPPRTREATTILSLYGLGLLLLLGCIFWQPLRGRTVGLFRARKEFSYESCDVGDTDGEKHLVKRLAEQTESADPVCATLARKWKAYAKTPAPPAARSQPATIPSREPALAAVAVGQNLPTESSGAAAAVAVAAPPAPATAVATGDAKPEPKESAEPSPRAACSLIRFLNAEVAGKSEMGEPLLLNSRWPMKSCEIRRLLVDGALDNLSNDAPDDSQLGEAQAARTAAQRLAHLRRCSTFGAWFAAVIIVGLAWLIGSDIWHDVSHAAHAEPFSLSNGVSAWPAIILRLAAVVLSLFFCLMLFSRMQVMFYELARRYRFPLESRPDPQKPEGPTSSGRQRSSMNGLYCWIREHCFPFHDFHDDASLKSGRLNAVSLWLRYRQGRHPVARLLRVLFPILCYFLLATVIYQLFGQPSQPIRGHKDDAIFEWFRFGLPSNSPFKSHIIVNLTFFFLTFLTIDAARLCCRFIQMLSAGSVEYPKATLAHFSSQRGNVSSLCLEEWVSTRLIADLTERVGKLLWFPGLIFFLLLLSRLPWWDNWPWHKGLVIIMTLNFCIALASVVILQRAARAAKRAAEERLLAKVKRLQAATASSPAQNDATQAENLLKEIRELHHGAFAPFWENPVFGAVLVGPGGLTILQMLVWFLAQ